MKYFVTALAGFCLLLLILPFFLFRIDEREMAVVLRFGAPRHAYSEPGIHFRMPLTDVVERMPKTKQLWGDTADVRILDLQTSDDKKIEVIPWAVWRIRDPMEYVQRIRSLDKAEQQVTQFVRGAIRDVVSQHTLEELVRSTSRKMQVEDLPTSSVPQAVSGAAVVVEPQLAGEPAATKVSAVVRYGRPQLLERMRQLAQKNLSSGDGNAEGSGAIELIDIGISQVGFVSSVREATFARWIADREAVSARNVSEGKRLKASIINEAKSEVARIEGEGQQRANEIRGKTDAEVIDRYAAAMNQAGEFFVFVRTLEAYEKSIGSDTRLILTTDSPFFDLFNQAIEGNPSSVQP
jgi:modulator of FtsH protease HflC